MKTQVKIIPGITDSGRKGIRYEHNIPIGAKVKLRGRRGVGTVIGPGIAGMPEVKLGKSSAYHSPHEITIIDEENAEVRDRHPEGCDENTENRAGGGSLD